MATEDTFHVDAPNGLFVRAIPTVETQIILHDRFNDAPGVIADDLHCTIIYAKNSVNSQLPFNLVDKDKRFLAYAQQLSYWPGVNGDGFLVLELNSTDLLLAHTNWKLYGLEPTFEVYKPHVTIAHPIIEEEALRYAMLMNSRPFMFLKALRFYNGGITHLREDAQ